jgi:hypothetical protein
MINLNSLHFHPGIHILSNLNKLLKNSRFSSTFLRPVASPSLADVLLAEDERVASRRCAAAFCSAMALRTRFMRATKRVRYTAREMRVRFWRYRVVISFTTDLTLALDSRCRNRGFDRTAMAIAGPGRATPCARCQLRVPCRHGLSFQSPVETQALLTTATRRRERRRD